MLLVTSMLTWAFDARPAKASGTVYIRADGSIDPPTAPILRNGDVYTLTDNLMSNSNGILIERDNMTLDGSDHTLRGSEDAGYAGGTNGTHLIRRTNITIINLCITNFLTGIMLDESSNCTLLKNVVRDNGYGIWFASSPNNRIIGNLLTHCGIYFWPSSADNHIVGNRIEDDYHGINIYFPWKIVSQAINQHD